MATYTPPKSRPSVSSSSKPEFPSGATQPLIANVLQPRTGSNRSPLTRNNREHSTREQVTSTEPQPKERSSRLPGQNQRADKAVKGPECNLPTQSDPALPGHAQTSEMTPFVETRAHLLPTSVSPIANNASSVIGNRPSEIAETVAALAHLYFTYQFYEQATALTDALPLLAHLEGKDK